MRIKIKLIYSMVFIAFLMGPQLVNTQAQGDVINNVRAALKAGSAKELIKYFHENVELNFDGEKSSYSKTQAEFVLRDFFKKYVPEDFQFIHQGAGKQGFKYAIGKYSFNDGSFRVWILFKHDNGNYYADSMDFTRE